MPISPVRICDTRPGNPSRLSGTVLTQCEGKAPGPGGVLSIQVAGLAGAPSGASGVALSLTAVDPTANGYLSVYPAGGSAPTISNVNFSAGDPAVANLVVSSLSHSGEVSIFNYAGTTQVVVDVEGYLVPQTSGSSAGYYVPLSPARICDTRPGNPSGLSGTAQSQCEGKAPAPGNPLQVQVEGVGGVPSSGVAAAVVDLTVIDPSAPGYLVASPAGSSPPTASNIDYGPGQVIATRAIVALDSAGAIEVTASSGTPQVAVDVEGYVTSSGMSAVPVGASLLLSAPAPARICDTRPDNPSGLSGAALTQCEGKTLGPGGTLTIQVTGLAGVPTGATAVIVNLTVTATSEAGYLSAFPEGTPLPGTSDLDWSAGSTVANLAVVPLSSSGQVTLYNYAGTAQVVVDVMGWAVPS